MTYLEYSRVPWYLLPILIIFNPTFLSSEDPNNMTQDGSNLALLSTIIVIINTIIIIIIQNFTRASQNTTRAIISRKQLVDIWSEPENH